VYDKKLEFLEVFFAFLCDLPSTRCSLDEADLEKVWFDDIFDRGDFFSNDGGKGRESDWFFIKCLDEMREELTIEDIETIGIDSESVEYCFTIRLSIDTASDRRIVAYDLDIAIRNAGSPASALGNRVDRSGVDRRHIEEGK
jgi:hypothetical protein